MTVIRPPAWPWPAGSRPHGPAPERNMPAPLTPAGRRARPGSRRRTFPAARQVTAAACQSDAAARRPDTGQWTHGSVHGKEKVYGSIP